MNWLANAKWYLVWLQDNYTFNSIEWKSKLHCMTKLTIGIEINSPKKKKKTCDLKKCLFWWTEEYSFYALCSLVSTSGKWKNFQKKQIIFVILKASKFNMHVYIFFSKIYFTLMKVFVRLTAHRNNNKKEKKKVERRSKKN